MTWFPQPDELSAILEYSVSHWIVDQKSVFDRFDILEGFTQSASGFRRGKRLEARFRVKVYPVSRSTRQSCGTGTALLGHKVTRSSYQAVIPLVIWSVVPISVH